MTLSCASGSLPQRGKKVDMTRQQQLQQLRRIVNDLNRGLIIRPIEVPTPLLDLPIFEVREHLLFQSPDFPGLLYLTEAEANISAAAIADAQSPDSILRADVETTSLRRILEG
jgi:hypothetical protein